MQILRDNQLPPGSQNSIPVGNVKAGRHSIQLEINRLASAHGTPEAFVSMVYDTFRGMGIPLHEHAGPYRYMLEALFRREEKLRKDRERVRAYLCRIRKLLGQNIEERPDSLRSGELLHRMWHGLEARSRLLTRQINDLRDQLKSLGREASRTQQVRWGVRSLRL